MTNRIDCPHQYTARKWTSDSESPCCKSAALFQAKLARRPTTTTQDGLQQMEEKLTVLMQALEHADIQAHADTQACRHASMQTLKHADTQAQVSPQSTGCQWTAWRRSAWLGAATA